MALLFNATADVIGSSTTPDGTYWAACFWHKRVGTPSTWCGLIDLGNAAGTTFLGLSYYNGSYRIEASAGTSAILATLPTQDVWAHSYIRSDNVGILAGIRYVTSDTYTDNTALQNNDFPIPSPADFAVGDYTINSYANSNTVIGALKVWSGSGNLPSVAQLKLESYRYLPIKTSGLWGAFPLFVEGSTFPNLAGGTVLDSYGTPTTSDGPPISWGGAPYIVVGQPTGAATNEGTLSQTLEAATVTASGEVDVAGEAALTLEAATVSATGAVRVDGALTEELDAATLSATGTVVSAIEGALSATLGELISAATATVEVQGTLAEELVGGEVLDACEGATGQIHFSSTTDAVGQSFVGVAGQELGGVAFYLQRTGTVLSGNIYAKLYAHSGTYGTSSVPTGAALATSDPVAASTIGTSAEWVKFTFPTPYELDAINYVIVVEHVDSSATSYLTVWVSTSGSEHSGNSSTYAAPAGPWSSLGGGGSDLTFRLFSAPYSGLTLFAGSGQVLVQGTLTEELASATLAAVGEVGVEGALVAELGALTLSGSAAAEVQGTLSQELDAATLTASAQVVVRGTLAEELEAATTTAAGTVRVSGEVSTTLGALSAAASGEVLIEGALDDTLEDATLFASTSGGAFGSLNVTLEAATASATADVVVSGEVSSTLDATTIAASGQVEVHGTLAEALGAATLAASGALTVSAELSETLGALTTTAAGRVLVEGSLAETLEDASLVASGTVSTGLGAELDVELDPLTAAVVGEVLVAGTLGVTLGNVVGGAAAATEGRFNGLMDEVGMFGSAFDAADAALLWNGGNGRYY